METDDIALFDVWTSRWKDLVSFEVVEIGQKPEGNSGETARDGCSRRPAPEAVAGR